MSLSRRGFLQTVMASLAGAAVFDPKALLWVPAPPEAVVLAADPAAISLQLELNDLALQCAKAMRERLLRHPSIALRQVMYEYAGHVRLPIAGSLEVEQKGRGYFEPCQTRLSVDAPAAGTTVNDLTYELHSQIAYPHGHRRRPGPIDMFAPIGSDLRVGEPFSPDVAVGIGTDPESGLSVRVLRYALAKDTMAIGGRERIGLEMAGGNWMTWHVRQSSGDHASWRSVFPFG